MDDGLNFDDVSNLIELSRSSDFRDRITAGRALVRYSRLGDASRALIVLLTDKDDTGVIDDVADEVLRSESSSALRSYLVARATGEATCRDHLRSSLSGYLFELATDNEKLESFRRNILTLSGDDDQRVWDGYVTVLREFKTAGFEA